MDLSVCVLARCLVGVIKAHGDFFLLSDTMNHINTNPLIPDTFPSLFMKQSESCLARANGRPLGDSSLSGVSL